MTKKERLGSDPFQDASLDWIQDTRKEKKKEDKKDDVDALTSKRFDVKASRRQNAKASKRQSVKTSIKKKHTIYLTLEQSKKLRVYAAANEMQLSAVIEKLINEHI
ncbi:MAG: hypothetical protein XE08_0102 [Parcubacteria bacterium 32_520]|nr:MAG: hypothetical protein XE08_0102 [Parcubacteria bacterium 32_520]HBY57440.1 hypothetical protein [Candidatus Atribacteria bacterium]